MLASNVGWKNSFFGSVLKVSWLIGSGSQDLCYTVWRESNLPTSYCLEVRRQVGVGPLSLTGPHPTTSQTQDGYQFSTQGPLESTQEPIVTEVLETSSFKFIAERKQGDLSPMICHVWRVYVEGLAHWLQMENQQPPPGCLVWESTSQISENSNAHCCTDMARNRRSNEWDRGEWMKVLASLLWKGNGVKCSTK